MADKKIMAKTAADSYQNRAFSERSTRFQFKYKYINVSIENSFLISKFNQYADVN